MIPFDGHNLTTFSQKVFLPMEPINKETQFNITYFFLAVIAILIIQSYWSEHKMIAHIPYSEFQQNLKSGNITEVTISDKQIRGSLKEPIKERKSFATTRVEHDLVKELESHNIKYSRIIENTFFKDILSWLIPIFVFFAIWIFLMRKMSEKGGGLSGGFMSVGKSKAKVYVESDTKVAFKDVAGVDEAKQELAEVVDFLRNPQEYGMLGARLPKGILLVGPPGTGKTLLAKAVAGEAGVPFFSISGSEFVEMFVGVGAARVRDLFEQSRKSAPCIIFIDELDALGKARGSSAMHGGHDEKEQTLNQLLVELDGFDSKSGIVLLGATNRPEILDPALLRAGRFDRQVLVDRPDKLGREQILKVHIKKIKIEDDLKIEQIAALTPGFTGADLANLVNEAALLATRKKRNAVSLDDFTDGIERIVAGLEKRNRLLNPHERKVVAHHEMGHAIVASCLGGDPVHKISIIPRGIGSLGYTIQRPTEDRYLMSKEELKKKMSVLMGGRAAELLIFNHLSTGASDDISKATEIARSMIMRYGMDPDLGHVSYDSRPSGYLESPIPYAETKYGNRTSEQIDASTKTLVDEALAESVELLEKNRTILESGAQALLDKETLNADDLSQILRGCS